jgi:ATP-dependent DNA ligase
VLFAFDLIEHDGDDLRDLPLIKRKWQLFRLLADVLISNSATRVVEL